MLTERAHDAIKYVFDQKTAVLREELITDVKALNNNLFCRKLISNDVMTEWNIDTTLQTIRNRLRNRKVAEKTFKGFKEAVNDITSKSHLVDELSQAFAAAERSKVLTRLSLARRRRSNRLQNEMTQDVTGSSEEEEQAMEVDVDEPIDQESSDDGTGMSEEVNIQVKCDDLKKWVTKLQRKNKKQVTNQSSQIKRLEEELKRAEEKRKRAEEELKRAEEDRKRAEEDRKRADEERIRAEEERIRAEEDRKRAEEDRKRAEEERDRAEEERDREKENARLKQFWGHQEIKKAREAEKKAVQDLQEHKKQKWCYIM